MASSSFSTCERRSLRRLRLERFERCEHRLHAFDDQLCDHLWAIEILEPMLTQLDRNDTLGEEIPDDFTRRRREENLTSVACGEMRAARCTGKPTKPSPTWVGSPVCLCHPHPRGSPSRPFMLSQRALSLHRRGDCVLSSLEGDEERVTLCVDDDSHVVLETVTENPPMIHQQLLVLLAHVLEQTRRTLDVRKQERDSA